jgi:hypothetical protein
MRKKAESTESTYDERGGGSTADLRKMLGGPLIVVFAISRALFCDFLLLLFVFFFNLFDVGGGFLVLWVKARVNGLQGPKSDSIPAGTQRCTMVSASRISTRMDHGLTSNHDCCSPLQ